MERTKEFIEPDLVNLSQGLVSVSNATTFNSTALEEIYTRNLELIEKYRIPLKEGSIPKVFNIFWQNHICGQIIIQIDKITNSGLISYWVDSQLSNRNIATNAVILIKQYSFDIFNLDYLEAYVQPDNVKSHRVLEKSGFIKTEAVFTYINPVGTGIEHCVYRIERDYLS